MNCRYCDWEFVKIEMWDCCWRKGRAFLKVEIKGRVSNFTEWNWNENFSYLCYEPMDCSLSGSSVHEISQVRILEWVAISFSRESPQPKDGTQIHCISYLAGGFFITEPHTFITWKCFRSHLICPNNYKLWKVVVIAYRSAAYR